MYREPCTPAPKMSGLRLYPPISLLRLFYSVHVGNDFYVSFSEFIPNFILLDKPSLVPRHPRPREGERVWGQRLTELVQMT